MIPDWKNVSSDPDCPEYECDDDAAMLLAVICAINGFDLPRFDLWLAALPSCDLKRGLLDLRKRAADALTSNNHEVALLCLGSMLDAWRNDLREQFLLPHARRGNKTKASARKGGAAKNQPYRERWPEYQNYIDALYAKNSRLTYADLQRKAAKKFGCSGKTIERRTVNPAKK